MSGLDGLGWPNPEDEPDTNGCRCAQGGRSLRLLLAIPPRLILAWLCDTSLDACVWVMGQWWVDDRWYVLLHNWVHQPLVRVYNNLWGKYGVWHTSYEIEHWPMILQ